jgi:hypothetical protein
MISSPSLILIILTPIRKTIERGDFAAIEFDVALVDFVPEKIQLGSEFVFGDLDMPRTRSAIRAVVPAIAPALQGVFKSKWSIFGPDAKRLLARVVE